MTKDTSYYNNEATRCFQNAKDILKKAGKNGTHYSDSKYVSSACGVAYKGALIALDGLLIARGIKPPKNRASIEYYRDSIGKIDRKMLSALNEIYEILHRVGYYDGFTNIKVIQQGFDEAVFLMNRIRMMV